ncbi:Rrf2 family transcriptional regulator [Pseudonocardia sp. NPDC046786]|uniref:RrF2 family transcriptional regulator n=1 Tax=Pseudonocardia sp. NPDC046786 TaxID=3155471 RepID=UPI0033C8EE1D
MRISTKADSAIRAALVLVTTEGRPATCSEIAHEQGIPEKYLEGILNQLRRAGLVRSQRGAEGGYWLSRPGRTITLAEVVRAVDGPMATVRGVPAQDLEYEGVATALPQVWIALRASIRAVMEEVTLSDVVEGPLPRPVSELSRRPGAWDSR